MAISVTCLMTRVPSGWPITEDVLATDKAVERSGNRMGNGWEWTEETVRGNWSFRYISILNLYQPPLAVQKWSDWQTWSICCSNFVAFGVGNYNLPRSNLQLIVYLGKVGMPLASLMVWSPEPEGHTMHRFHVDQHMISCLTSTKRTSGAGFLCHHSSIQICTCLSMPQLICGLCLCLSLCSWIFILVLPWACQYICLADLETSWGHYLLGDASTILSHTRATCEASCLVLQHSSDDTPRNVG